jgi:hypothetical protein
MTDIRHANKIETGIQQFHMSFLSVPREHDKFSNPLIGRNKAISASANISDISL